MKKLVSTYEEKSKLIEEIQRNFRSPTKHIKDKPHKYQHQTLSFDLPSITRDKKHYLGAVKKEKD